MPQVSSPLATFLLAGKCFHQIGRRQQAEPTGETCFFQFRRNGVLLFDADGLPRAFVVVFPGFAYIVTSFRCKEDGKTYFMQGLSEPSANFVGLTAESSFVEERALAGSILEDAGWRQPAPVAT